LTQNKTKSQERKNASPPLPILCAKLQLLNSNSQVETLSHQLTIQNKFAIREL